MTEGEYYAIVENVATSIVSDLGVHEWLAVNYLDIVGGREPSFEDFLDEESYRDNGTLDSYIDSYFCWSSVKDAADLISATRQDPDDVDSGLYEGASPTRVFTIIAYSLFEQDVYCELEELYDEAFDKLIAGTLSSESSVGKMSEAGVSRSVLAFPTHSRQIGYHPKRRRFGSYTAPNTPFSGNGFFTIGEDDACVWKINVSSVEDTIPVTTYLCLEGKSGKKGDLWYIDARRIYIMDDFKGKLDVQKALRYALTEYIHDRGWVEEDE